MTRKYDPPQGGK